MNMETNLTDEQKQALIELASQYLNAKPKMLFSVSTKQTLTPERFVTQTLAKFGLDVRVRDADESEKKRADRKAAKGTP